MREIDTETNLTKTQLQNKAIMAVTSVGKGEDGTIREEMGK